MYLNLLIIILLIKPSLPQKNHPKAIPKESCFTFHFGFTNNIVLVIHDKKKKKDVNIKVE